MQHLHYAQVDLSGNTNWNFLKVPHLLLQNKYKFPSFFPKALQDLTLFTASSDTLISVPGHTPYPPLCGPGLL